MEKRKLSFLLFGSVALGLLLLGQASAVWAASGSDDAKSGLNAAAGDLLGRGDLITTAGTIIQVVLGFLGIIFVILVLYAGFIRMTAQGDAAKVKKSTDIITGAVVGLIIIFTSYIVTTYVIDKITTVASSGSDQNSQEACCIKSGAPGEPAICDSIILGGACSSADYVLQNSACSAVPACITVAP
jgi:hypothetical protein